MNKSEHIGKLAEALAKAQGAIKHALKDSTNPHFKSSYADLASIWEACRKELSDNGLSVVQPCDFNEVGGLIVETTLMHSSGEWISGKLFMPVPQATPQGIGSAITYARRYSLAAMVGIAPDDDDGEAAHGRGTAVRPVTAPPTAPPATTDPKDAEYLERIKVALHAYYGADRKAALDKVEELTSFIPKGKTESERVKGVRDFTKLSGKRLEILAHAVEKLKPVDDALFPDPPAAKCPDCGGGLIKGACRSMLCPSGRPAE